MRFKVAKYNGDKASAVLQAPRTAVTLNGTRYTQQPKPIIHVLPDCKPGFGLTMALIVIQRGNAYAWLAVLLEVESASLCQ